LGAEESPIRIAAYADVHAHADLRGRLRQELETVNDQADALVLAGDLTLFGAIEEAHVLIEELRSVRIPIIGVLGNHDFELSQDAEIRQAMIDTGVIMLDGGTHIVEVRGERVGFAGVKGFCGGFGERLVAPFGEAALKAFVRVGQIETEKLGDALCQLHEVDQVDHVVGVCHYAPIRETVVGESMELWPYLGNSSLCQPIEQHGADVVFHGHAHYGSPFGRTPSGIPVYNVARPLVRTPIVHHLSRKRVGVAA